MRTLRPARAVLPLVGGLLAGCLIGACGVPHDGAVETVAAQDVPYGLLAGRPSPASPTAGQSAGTLDAYFVLGERLVAVPVVEQPGDDPLGAALDALAAGPTATQQQDGLGTSIPPGLHLGRRVSAAGTVTVDLRGDTAQPDIAQNPLSTGQIVLSVTALPGYRKVLLTRDGKPLEAVLPSGELTGDPVTADDYRQLTATRTP